MSLNDQLTVTFQLRDAQSSREPDFSPLQASFDILANQKSMQTRNINGVKDSHYEWHLTLSPKRYGKLTIPTISIGAASTEAISIEVAEARDIADSISNLFMTLSADKQSVYVQEQVLITIKLFSKLNWQNKELQPFTLDDALYEAVSENEYISEISGVQHLVYELTLAIYPQKSGALVIPSLQFLVRLRSQRRSTFSFNNGPLQRVNSTPLNIKVKTAPSLPNTTTWLPAKTLTLEQHWSHNTQTLVAGEPITRTITINADGLSKAQLPPIEFLEHADINSYKDKEQTDEQRSNKGIISQRIETVAMVPNKAGKIILPPVELSWWNTKTNKAEVATIPEQQLTVAMPLNATPIVMATPPELQSMAVNNTAHETTGFMKGLIISQIITGLLLAVLLYLYLKKQPSRAEDIQQAAHTKTVQTNLTRALKRAAEQQDFPSLRKYLLLWAEANWNTTINSLDEITQYTNDPDLENAIKVIDRNIYRGESTIIEAASLLNTLRSLKGSKVNNTDNFLKNLHPR